MMVETAAAAAMTTTATTAVTMTVMAAASPLPSPASNYCNLHIFSFVQLVNCFAIIT